VLTNPIDYLLALLIIYYNIKMIVELFYLLAFIVGLGAVFVFLVLGQNKKEDDRGDTLNKILAHKNIHNIFKQ